MNGNNGHYEGQPDLRVACSSLFGEPAQLILIAHTVGLVLVLPATATAALSPTQRAALCTTLDRYLDGRRCWRPADPRDTIRVTCHETWNIA